MLVDDDAEDDVTEPCESPAEIMDTVDSSDHILSIDPGLEDQLRPVFNMCGPDSRGRISIEHLEKMCRENGQVRGKFISLIILQNKLFCVLFNLCLCSELWVCLNDNNSILAIRLQQRFLPFRSSFSAFV